MRLTLTLALAVLLGLAANATADVIDIDSYNILHTRASGGAGWSHTYDGTITPEGGLLYTYTGGSGTLNDGIVGVSVSDTHLFQSSYEPVITLNMAASATFNSILVHGSNNASNGIPGMLTGMTVTIGAVSVALTSTPTGPAFCGDPGYCDDLFTLTGTALEGLTGDVIVLSNFVSAYGTGEFSITEIDVDGAAASGVPEPGTVTLIGAGLAGLAILRRRKRQA